VFQVSERAVGDGEIAHGIADRRHLAQPFFEHPCGAKDPTVILHGPLRLREQCLTSHEVVEAAITRPERFGELLEVYCLWDAGGANPFIAAVQELVILVPRSGVAVGFEIAQALGVPQVAL
jgi:hypothetical protein